MARDEHNKAAEHHENAAKSHRAAAEQHGKGTMQRAKNIHLTPSNTPRMLANPASKPITRASSKSKLEGPTKVGPFLLSRPALIPSGSAQLQFSGSAKLDMARHRSFFIAPRH